MYQPQVQLKYSGCWGLWTRWGYEAHLPFHPRCLDDVSLWSNLLPNITRKSVDSPWSAICHPIMSTCNRAISRHSRMHGTAWAWLNRNSQPPEVIFMGQHQHCLHCTLMRGAWTVCFGAGTLQKAGSAVYQAYIYPSCTGEIGFLSRKSLDNETGKVCLSRKRLNSKVCQKTK